MLKIILLFIINLFLLFIVQCNEIENIFINQNEQYLSKEIGKINSSLFYINGYFNNDKKFLLIHIIDNDPNKKNKSPYLFITKKKNFNFSENSYDYTSIKDSDYGNKIAIPQYYFNSEDTNGFYLNITCHNFECLNIQMNLSFTNEINLSINESFSFYAKEKDYNLFKIQINNLPKEKIGILIAGGDSNQIQMKVNKLIARKIFQNAYAVIIDNIEEEKKINIEINVTQNVNFFFKAEILTSTSKYIYENSFNQYYFIENKKTECFNVIASVYDNDIKRDITIIGQKEFSVNIICVNKGESNKILFSSNEKDDLLNNYIVSDGLYCNGPIQNICITSSQEKISLINIYINKNQKIKEPLHTDLSYKYFLDNNNISIHTHNQFFNKKENSLIVGIKVLYGEINAYLDKCITYPSCDIDKEYLINKIKQEDQEINLTDFKTLYSINNYFTTEIKTDSFYMNNNQWINIIQCNNKEGCGYEINYYTINKIKRLNSDNNYITKILLAEKKDDYEIYLHNNKKILIDLIIIIIFIIKRFNICFIGKIS